MQKDNLFKLRPAGRHILAMGRELIKDNYSAVMELVKNAYDADSESVKMKFELDHINKNIKITIKDFGHGMSRETVLKKWLIPSTDDKLKRKKSPKGRVMQGRKGLGRYAAAILGNTLKMQTVDQTGYQTLVDINWSDFDNAEFMDEVELPIETSKVSDKPGTEIHIFGDKEFYEFWDESEFNNLKFELKKLISPIHENNNYDDFKLYLDIQDSRQGGLFQGDEKIEPFPLLDYYDYKISGRINNQGKGLITFVNNKEQAVEDDQIIFNFGNKTKCGDIEIDIRVYDRESQSIDNLIKKGLKDESGNYLNKSQAKSLLNQSNGIGVYRNGFRIRPLGNPDFDWLKLNSDRVQNPSLHIGSNQVIGFVKIQSEELSNLKETSARDGIKDNKAYQNLIAIVKNVLSELEVRRFAYRRKSGLTKGAVKIEQDFEKLFSFIDVKKQIKKTLIKEGMSEESTDEIFKILDDKEADSAKLIQDIKKKVAIYQGQATLGKIVDVVMHEVRKPLGFFNNQSKNLDYWVGEYVSSPSPENKNEILKISKNFNINTNVLSELFNRLDPLATTQRGKKTSFKIKDSIHHSISVFSSQIKENNILININCDENIELVGWINDIYVIITNLLDNSIFWLIEKDIKNKEINIIVRGNDSLFEFLDYKDNGPGISKELIETESIFEPQFSTKVNGIGIGLPIAGEAAHRNKLDLKAFESDTGVYFRLQSMEE
ncbi:sensor histidine kinase [Pseudoalteromonas sp. APC 3356]|uniref:sensor histidine kinase n=1 Tax=Pseudoalteromonas sp. APC 3356 TaxID=3035185 RepID=UPI0025B508A1|nr:sensor histidine kinase [Pseudoalteromonas sp. APC 3356]MDN3434874.1 sensor histidine kinase [Pseudoalteromonas sp. APC 3356]